MAFDKVGTRLKRGRHQVLRTSDLQRFVARVLPKSATRDLVSLYDHRTQRFYLGKWVDRTAGLVIEFCSWGHQDPPTRDDVSGILFNLDRRRWANALRNLLRNWESQERAQWRKDMDRRREQRARAEWYIRNKMPPRAQGLGMEKLIQVPV